MSGDPFAATPSDGNRPNPFDFADGPFGAPPMGPPPRFVKSPFRLLILAVVVPLVTTPIFFFTDLSWHIVGWAVAVPGMVALVWAFTIIDLKRRLMPGFVDNPKIVSRLRIAALAVGLLVGLVHAYQIADLVSRWDAWA
jgi:hypothetical protein